MRALLLLSASLDSSHETTFSVLPLAIPVVLQTSPKTSIVPPLFRQMQAESFRLPSQTSMGEQSFTHMFPASGWLIVETFSGADGSRSIKTVQVDASGTGKNFVAAQMVVNGDAVRISIVPGLPSHSPSPRILRPLVRNSSLPSSLPAPNALVVPTKTFALRPLLPLLVSEIVSQFHKPLLHQTLLRHALRMVTRRVRTRTERKRKIKGKRRATRRTRTRRKGRMPRAERQRARASQQILALRIRRVRTRMKRRRRMTGKRRMIRRTKTRRKGRMPRAERQRARTVQQILALRIRRVRTRTQRKRRMTGKRRTTRRGRRTRRGRTRRKGRMTRKR
jgi:hypothetical protein